MRPGPDRSPLVPGFGSDSRSGEIGRLPPGDRRAAAERRSFDDAADLLDEFAGGLGDAIDRLGVQEIEQNHTSGAAGLVRAQADQLRNDSRAPVRLR